MAGFRDHAIICTIILLLFGYISMRSRLIQFFSFLLRSTQISNAVASNMLLILRRRRRARRHRNPPQVWVYPRNQHWFEEIIRNPAMHRFWKEHFRINLDSFQELCRVLAPQMMKRDTRFRAAVPLEKRVAIGLWRLATGESYRSTSVTFGVGKCTALNIVHEFVRALIHVREDYLSFPSNGRALENVMQKFELKHGLPQVAGVIDGSHIKIKAPEKDHEAYFNRKQCYSIVLQGVVDSECKFLDVSTGFPGSVHDARIFRRSALYRNIIAGDIMAGARVVANVNIRPYLIGDTAYPLSPYLMTAYHSGRLTPAQERFNKILTKLRVVVERAYGKLKIRWRCILKELEDDTQRVADITLACCILHNFCIIMGDEFDEDDDDDDSDDDDDEDGREDDEEGQEIRCALTEYLS